jgi:hypothetical protein
MTFRLIIFEVLYYLGSGFLLIYGIFFKTTAPLGFGIFLIYTGRTKIPLRYNKAAELKRITKFDIIWDFIFLGISSIALFSLMKTVLNILLRDKSVQLSSWVVLFSCLGIIYFELLFRLSSSKRNRFAALYLLILLIFSAGSFILGGFWVNLDIILGFLSLAITVIISFSKAYKGLLYILQPESK